MIPALKLAKFIDNNSIDIIHFHWTRDIATVVFAKLFSKKKPQIIQSRHMRITRFKDDFYHKWLYKNINTIHAVTNQLKEQLERFIPLSVRPKIQHIYLGVKETKIDDKLVDNLRTKYKLEDSFVVGIVGRIEEGKGQYIVIDAMKKLKDSNIKILIVGNTMDEEYLNTLKAKVSDMGLDDKVIFTGFTNNVDEHIKLCDVTVLATPMETFGLVVIESMINKVCVIATNKGGPLEIIDDKIDGLLFERSSDDLSKKINSLYLDPSYKEKLSSNAYEKAKVKFNSEKQNRELYKIVQGMKD